MKKTLTIQFVARLKAALVTAGYRVTDNVGITEDDRFSFDIFGIVPYTGTTYRERVHVSTGTIPGRHFSDGRDAVAKDGELLVAMEAICGGMTNYLRRYARVNIPGIVDDIVKCNKQLDHNAKYSEAWNECRKQGYHNEGAKTRFMNKYLAEHFPGEFPKLK